MIGGGRARSRPLSLSIKIARRCITSPEIFARFAVEADGNIAVAALAHAIDAVFDQGHRRKARAERHLPDYRRFLGLPVHVQAGFARDGVAARPEELRPV